MNTPPPALPEVGDNQALYRWLNWMRAFSISAQVKPSVNSTWERSGLGTTIVPKPGGAPAAPATDDLTWL
jgi:hypothetical protein